MTSKTQAIRIYEYGEPGVMRLETIDIPAPGPHEVLIKQTACGLNYIDVYMRTGLYGLASLPGGLGLEAAGQIEAVGARVVDFKPGDRVAYITPPAGAYAGARVMPADKLVKLPDAISDKTAAAVIFKGLTAQYLLRRVYPVKAGDVILIHAAAGGVGLLVCQWAKYLGATVIGTVGSEAKAKLAHTNGCDHTILYRKENFKDKVHEITNAAGVNVVYDSIGKDTFIDSLDCLRPLGTMVSFGNATGPVEPIAPSVLTAKGSLFLTRPTLFAYAATRKDLLSMADDLFKVVTSGIVKITINQEYSLANAAQAHMDLEARKTTGSTILIP